MYSKVWNFAFRKYWENEFIFKLRILFDLSVYTILWRYNLQEEQQNKQIQNKDAEIFRSAFCNY